MKLDFTRPRHPDEETLLAWSEGELNWWRAVAMSRHVRSCWQCRLKAKEWEDLVCTAASGVQELQEPSRVDTAKAYWRFREACLRIDTAEKKRGWRLSPAWMTAVASVIAAAGVAVVTIEGPLHRDAGKPVTFTRPAPARRFEAPAPAPPAAPLRPTVVPRESAVEGTTLAPSAEAAPSPSEEELLSAEVYALYELHRARLCRLDVGRSGSSVVVHGVVVSTEQRNRLAALFQAPEYSGLIRLRFEEAPESPGRPASGSGTTPNQPLATAPLESRLRDQFGPQATQRDIFNRMGELVLGAETVSEHAWALRHLADRFPPSRSRSLRPALRDLLLRMASDHAAAVVAAAESLWKEMAPERGESAVGMFEASDPGGRNQSWQERALALQEMAEAAASGLLASASPKVSSPPPPRKDFEYCAAAARGLHTSLQIQIAQAP